MHRKTIPVPMTVRSKAMELLPVGAMARADALAISGGVPGFTLMRAAGAGCAAILHARWPRGRVVVLAGPGNNGGDGFVIAERLKTLGREVRLGLLGSPDRLKGDAATAHGLWRGETEPARAGLLDGAAIIVDALFGTGLDRPLAGEAAALAKAVTAARRRGAAVLAVDVPSGVSGDTGAPLGPAVEADLTVTFFRKKPGHLLLPGRIMAGEVMLIDIGIPESVLGEAACGWFENGPGLWLDKFPRPSLTGHKYDRGHAVVTSGGPSATGAARLAALAALRIGAGLVTVASPEAALAVNAAHLTAIMLQLFADEAGFAGIIADRRRNAVLIGPGNGVGEGTASRVLAALGLDKAVVLDADALTSFATRPEALFQAIATNAAPAVLTPHMGEFSRLFGDTDFSRGKVALALDAARRSGAVVLLKGADTVVATPDGRVSINANAPPTLATAGAGDVLAGFITGLLAQGMPAFEAASAAAWIHGAAATGFGPGLIAEDLSGMVPGVLRDLLG
jgi:NAD(P)H-hydrate epimerase